MTGKRITISLFVLAALPLCVLAGCWMTRDTVRVTDAVSGLPIRDAHIVPVYPSMGGAGSPGYATDRKGIARIGGFGLPRGGYGVYISAAGYHTNFFATYPTSENHGGWRGNHLDVLLQPISKP